MSLQLFEFCLGSIFDKFGPSCIKGVSLKDNLYDFSIDYNAIDKLEFRSI